MKAQDKMKKVKTPESNEEKGKHTYVYFLETYHVIGWWPPSDSSHSLCSHLVSLVQSDNI